MRCKSVMLASAVVLGAIALPGPGVSSVSASAGSLGIWINSASIMMLLDASPGSGGGYESSGVTKTVAWYLCDSATSFTSTRSQPFSALGSTNAIETELTTEGCVEVPNAVIDLGAGAKISQFYEDDATLFKKPKKPYLTFTVRWSDSGAFPVVPYAVDAVADASRLRTLTSFPTLTKGVTGFSATDATWGESAGNFEHPRSEYWVCDAQVAAGAGMLDFATGVDPTLFTGAISGCRPLYTDFFWEPEAEEWFPSRTTAPGLARDATLYIEPPGTEFDQPVPVDLTGKHIVRVSTGHPYITWTGSQPWGWSDAPDYTMQGYFQPVDTARTVNPIRRASVLPLKFRVYDGETLMTDPSIISFSVLEVNCADTTPIGSSIQFQAAGSTTLRWSADDSQFIHNWRVPSTVGKCYRVSHTVDAVDTGTGAAGASIPTNVVTTVVQTR